jgi:hypothetical protein
VRRQRRSHRTKFQNETSGFGCVRSVESTRTGE